MYFNYFCDTFPTKTSLAETSSKKCFRISQNLTTIHVFFPEVLSRSTDTLVMVLTILSLLVQLDTKLKKGLCPFSPDHGSLMLSVFMVRLCNVHKM